MVLANTSNGDNCICSRSDPELGDFYADARYCDKRCLRDELCCGPETVQALATQFFLTDDTVLNYPIGIDSVAAAKKLIGRDRQVVFVVHGFLENINLSGKEWNDTRTGWVNRGAKVITVDWSRGNRLYRQAIANVRVVGALVGQLIRRLDIADRTLCVGFSLGAQVCGEAGAWLRKKGLTLAKCHGLDPAAPGYDGCGLDLRLDPTDCGVVTVIHSSQWDELFSTDIIGCGTKFKSGHCDFWMNDALTQPG